MTFSSLYRCLEGHDVFSEVHDGAIDLGSRSADDVELVEEFDDSELGSAGLVSVANGDVAFRLEVGDVELEEFRV